MRSLILQDWPAPVTTEDPLIAKRVEFYKRFSPEVAGRHWKRWLEHRAAIDLSFDREHPYWREHIKQRQEGYKN